MKKLLTTKTGHLFQTIFLVLCLLLACMLAYMSFFMDRFVLQDWAEELDRSNLAILEQANDSVLQTVDTLEQQVDLFLTDQNTLRYLLSDQITQAEDRMHILQNMENYANLFPQITALWLYAPLTNTVLSSDGYLTPRSGSLIDLLLTQYESQDVPRSASDMRLSALIMNGHLYILIDFIPSEWLGCFVFQVDPQSMGLDLAPALPPILVTDRNGNLLLEGSTPTKKNQQFDLAKTTLFYSDPDAPHTDQHRYYQVSNDALGWTLLMELHSSSDQNSATLFWVMVIPFLLVLLLLGAAGAYYITKKVYAPIDRLLAMVGVPNNDRPREEADYLASTYARTLTDNQNLRARFTDLGRDMRKHLFREAVDGHLSSTLDSDAIRAFVPEGQFQAALLRLGKSDVELHSDDKYHLLHSALENLLHQLPECICCLEESLDTLLVILHFSTDHESIATLLDNFCQNASRQIECQVFCGLGHSCNDPYHLCDSYQQAALDLEYHISLASATPAAALALKAKALKSQLNQFLDQAFQTQEETATQALLLVQLAEEEANDSQERLQNYRLTRNLLLDRLRTWDASAELPTLEITDTCSREDFLDFCHISLEMGRSMAGKKKFRYIEESKKFIQENYQNCSLSANDISAQIGISTSYFSSLFNDVQGESVTSYLNQIRVEQAKVLLATTSLSIKEIGQRCGFNSANVFGRVFKKYTGRSPSQYREDPTSAVEGGVRNE